MPRDRGAEACPVPSIQGDDGRDLRFCLGPHDVRLHSSTARGSSAVGLFVFVRSAFEHLVHLRAVVDDEGYVDGKPQVKIN